jgi:gluconolactonase
VLYVSQTKTSVDGPSGPPEIRAYPVAADGRSVTEGEHSVFAIATVGVHDGFRVDVHDNVWTSAGDGVHCYAPDGTLIGKIKVPEVVANVEFGGAKRNRLYMCGTTSLYAMYVNTRAATAALLE